MLTTAVMRMMVAMLMLMLIPLLMMIMMMLMLMLMRMRMRMMVAMAMERNFLWQTVTTLSCQILLHIWKQLHQDKVLAVVICRWRWRCAKICKNLHVCVCVLPIDVVGQMDTLVWFFGNLALVWFFGWENWQPGWLEKERWACLADPHYLSIRVSLTKVGMTRQDIFSTSALKGVLWTELL